MYTNPNFSFTVSLCKEPYENKQETTEAPIEQQTQEPVQNPEQPVEEKRPEVIQIPHIEEPVQTDEPQNQEVKGTIIEVEEKEVIEEE